ncbi:MAG: leucine-rich repeat domain-containing protein [Bacteroidetes bacterium]|nr:leucine-rich repeat domain-containing protein [Bacteroidota bacterium]
MMRTFLQSQLAGQSGNGVVDLCLDHKLIADIHPQKFTEMEGLELFPDLRIFSAAMHEIRTLAGLECAKRLLELDLSLNEISDISGVELLAEIQRLRLSHNEIASLTGISFPASLQELDLGFNQLTDISTLSELPNLEILILNGNRGLANLNGVPIGIKELHVTQAFVSDFERLQSLKGLESLSISPGSMGGLILLEELPGLQSLKVSAGRISGNLNLPALHGLKTLRIHKAIQTHSISGLNRLETLQHLDIGNSLLENPPNLEGMNLLEVLEIKFSPLKTLNGVAELKALKQLILTGSSIPQEEVRKLKVRRPELEIEL